MRTTILPSLPANTPFHLGASGPRTVSVPMRQLESSTLFDGAREVRIEHLGQEYRLRQTRNGKLILTK